MKPEYLANKKILVTGATSGIGKCLTLKLIEYGAQVAWCGRNENKATELILEIKNKRSNYFYKTFDVSKEGAIVNFVEEAHDKLGEIDILVNCAGVNSSKDLVSNIKSYDLEWMLKINLVAPFIFMREVYKRMSIDSPGMFINVLSTVCNFSNEETGSYTASKAGFDALVKVFRKEVREHNKKVCSIYPGGVDTPFREASKPQYLRPETVADAIISMLHYDSNTSIDELVVRPLIEKNYS